MSWNPVSSQLVGFLVLGLLLYGEDTYGSDDHTYDFKKREVGREPAPPGEWYPRNREDSNWPTRPEAQ